MLIFHSHCAPQFCDGADTQLSTAPTLFSLMMLLLMRPCLMTRWLTSIEYEHKICKLKMACEELKPLSV